MDIKVKKVEFLKSIADIEVYKKSAVEYPYNEICVVGRSNVGKSSFINLIAGQKISKTSSTPGRTRFINLFPFSLVSNEKTADIMIVDLPGYGFAQAAKNEKNKWGELIENYLLNSQKLIHIFSLVDSRHTPTELDKQMIKFMYHHGLQFTVIATKCDKLSKNELNKNLMNISMSLSIGKDNIIAVSAVNKMNLDKTLDRLYSLAAFHNENQ